MQFRKDIQGLRALAFLLVFLFHLNPKRLPGGYIGVDLFFVISGYLLSTIVLNQLEAGTFRLRSFYEKRVKRIFPAYFFMLLAVVAAGYFLYLPTDLRPLRGNLLQAMLFITNHLFAGGTAYFDEQNHENPMLHTWSLAIEVQFYVLIPLMLLLIKRRALPYVVTALIIGLTAYSNWRIYADGTNTAVYFSLLARIPEFLLGTLFSLLSLRPIRLGRMATVSAAIGMAGILASALLLDAESDFPGFLTVIPCVSAGLILISGRNAVTELLSLKPLVQLGAWSYSLYLWHWPVIAFMHYHMVDFGKPVYLLITAVTFALAYLSYTLVEQRFNVLDTRRFIKALTPVVLLVGITGYFLPVYGQKHAIDKFYTGPVFGLESHGKPFIETLGSKHPTWDTRILLIGDSHALMLKPFLDAVGKRAGFAFSTITSNAYPAIAGMEEDEVPKTHVGLYHRAMSLVPPTEQAIQHSDIIIFVSHNYDELASLKDALALLSTSLHPDQKLILIKSNPILRKHPLRINRSIRKTGNYAFTAYDLSRSAELVDELVTAYPNVYSYDIKKSEIFDATPFFNDTLTYYNGGHINTYASLAIADDLYADFCSFLIGLRAE